MKIKIKYKSIRIGVFRALCDFESHMVEVDLVL